MKLFTLLLILFLAQTSSAQEQHQTENPLSELNNTVKRVLDNASVPFSDEQEQAIILMMDERQRASEEMFGEIMDFRSGPTRGEEADRLNSAIQWMQDEFLKRLQDYLTPDQLVVWEGYQASVSAPVVSAAADTAARKSPQPARQTQYVRINNNAFTSEDGNYRYSFSRNNGGNRAGSTEVIQRGGIGTFHGNAQLLWRDESLNARNPFAHNKPPYQERRASFDISGPIIPGRLTAGVAASHNEAKNVDTIHASTPEGLFDLGITRPTTFRSVGTDGTYQLSDKHSLSYNFRQGTNVRDNQGPGGFTLPSRASSGKNNFWNLELKQFSALSSHQIYETRFQLSTAHDETLPASEALRINVLDAFNTGGAQNRSENRGRSYEFGNLYSRLGEKTTVKAGMDGVYRRERSFSTGNFGGTYTFSSLYDYCGAIGFSGNGCQAELQKKLTLKAQDDALDITPRPAANYRVSRGEPLIETDQLELSFFLQNDYKLTPRLTVMVGARYDYQTNLNDRNNIAPRIGFAYGMGRATVIRGGAGIFYQRIGQNIFETQRRLDGKHQYEIVIDNPSFPDPFLAGTLRNSLASIRVTDPTLRAPYSMVSLVSFERTFLTNFLVSASYDFNKELRRARYRNLNAPFDSTASFPRSCLAGQTTETCVRPLVDRGNIMSLESTGGETGHTFRVNLRERFSIFNVTGGYTFLITRGDSTPNPLGGSLGEGPSDSYNLRADWGRSAFPLHQFNGALNAQLPLGFFLTGTVNTSTGRRYTITTGKDDNKDTVVNDRPIGTPRNSVHGPNYLAFGFNISKAFFFGSEQDRGRTSRKNMNVFANMTNAFNRPNLGTPSGVMTSPNFGRSTSAQDPREIEVGLRFQF